MRRFLLTIVIILMAGGLSAFAQEKGKVIVSKDPLIDSLIARRLELSAGANSISSTGYRVQIYSGLEREQAYAEQTRFKAAYPSVRTYISYVQPYYRVRVGDFRTRLEAEKFMNELRRRYSSMFIFSEKINLR